jgi:hypothetical protein
MKPGKQVDIYILQAKNRLKEFMIDGYEGRNYKVKTFFDEAFEPEPVFDDFDDDVFDQALPPAPTVVFHTVWEVMQRALWGGTPAEILRRQAELQREIDQKKRLEAKGQL